MTYNTNQWLIFNFPAGSGGKFLCTCFLQFNKVAHWSGNQLSANEIITWYNNTLPNAGESWPSKEMDTPWVLPGISRSYPRGNSTTEEEFNIQLAASQNKLLHDYWSKQLIITDFWHKSQKPAWWTNANWISIYIDDLELYKKLMFSKLFTYENNTVIDINNRPDFGRQIAYHQKSIFQNQWLWENVNDYHQFINETVMKFPYIQCWDFDNKPDNVYITLTELFQANLVYKFMLQFEDQFKQKVSKEYVNTVHDAWLKATQKHMSRLS